ncbi:hypothetical protein EJB05_27624 [Eragrostis curvula]|uniref:C2H2-type domain-containing protein n=1 Tax=Eragrostis curvula TaxID=38414 RepID=A0A5J9UN04_9POAL|nr:hypothetical protein EJB05_27624 [Eragrostis curvula]
MDGDIGGEGFYEEAEEAPQDADAAPAAGLHDDDGTLPAAGPHEEDAPAAAALQDSEDSDGPGSPSAIFIAAVRAAFAAAPEGEQPCIECMLALFEMGKNPAEAKTYRVASIRNHYQDKHRQIMRNKRKRSECSICRNWFATVVDRKRHQKRFRHCAANVDIIESAVHNSPSGEGLTSEKLTVLNKLKELCSLRQHSTLPSQDCVDSTSDQCVPEETQVNANLCCDPSGATAEDRTSFQEWHGNADASEIEDVTEDVSPSASCWKKFQILGLPSVHYSYMRNIKPGLPLFLFNACQSCELVSDWDDLDDDVSENQFGPHSNPDAVSQRSLVKSVDQRMQHVECNHPAVNPLSGEKGTMYESMLVTSHNEHTGAANVDVIESAVHNSPGGEGLTPEKLTVLNKLKEMCSLQQQSTLPSQDCVDSTSDQCVPEETQVNANLCCDPFDATIEDKTSFQEWHGNADASEPLQIITELTKRTGALEKKQIGSDQHIHSMREVVEDSGIKVQQLEYLVDDLQFKFLAKPSIFLIGGYNGVTWLSSLDSLTPDKDVLVGLTPICSARSYAPAAVLDGHIFAFGGGDAMSWYNTVECYSLRNTEWAECPSLNRMKGSLAGISLQYEIYAIGGGDGNETFSEVEVFDPYLGKWICSPSMLSSRFDLADVEMHGVIYTACGYDGSMYMENRTAERYDPREGFWVKLPSMNTRRGCNVLTVLGEALHAMGGYNGESMVSSVEIYDPRLNAWRMADPMHTPRGYAAAVYLNDSLFLIGWT